MFLQTAFFSCDNQTFLLLFPAVLNARNRYYVAYLLFIDLLCRPKVGKHTKVCEHEEHERAKRSFYYVRTIVHRSKQLSRSLKVQGADALMILAVSRCRPVEREIGNYAEHCSCCNIFSTDETVVNVGYGEEQRNISGSGMSEKKNISGSGMSEKKKLLFLQ